MSDSLPPLVPPPPIPPGRLILRALRLRCPACGGRPIFLAFGRLSPNCPVCGIRLERGERGYWLGAYFFNLMAVETVFVLAFVGVLVATWPTPPWDLLQYGIGVLMLLAPVLCFPHSKTLFLAFDLFCRPPEAEDYASPREAAWLTRPRRRRR